MRLSSLSATHGHARYLIPAIAVLGSISAASWGVGYTRFLRGGAFVSAASGTVAATPSLQADSTPLAFASQPSMVAVKAESASKREPSSFVKAGLDHPRVDSWTQRLSTTLKADMQLSLDRMAKYTDMITAKLDERGMPHDLIYLAMIESRFDPKAKSTGERRGALAVHGRPHVASGSRWAMAWTSGKIPPQRPMRRSRTSRRSTKQFGSWYLAAAAYNSGEGTVARALKKVTGRTTGTDADFFRILPKLPRETRDYVPKLVASAQIGGDPAKFGLRPTGVAPN